MAATVRRAPIRGVWQAGRMSDETPDPNLRSIDLTRIGETRYKATNGRGGVLPIGVRRRPGLHPGRAAARRDRRVQRDRRRPDHRQAGRRPVSFDVHAEGTKVRDEHGNHLTGLHVTFDVRFPEGEAGDRARGVLPGAIEKSRDRLCTVGRTVAGRRPDRLLRG